MFSDVFRFLTAMRPCLSIALVLWLLCWCLLSSLILVGLFFFVLVVPILKFATVFCFPSFFVRGRTIPIVLFLCLLLLCGWPPYFPGFYRFLLNPFLRCLLIFSRSPFPLQAAFFSVVCFKEVLSRQSSQKVLAHYPCFAYLCSQRCRPSFFDWSVPLTLLYSLYRYTQTTINFYLWKSGNVACLFSYSLCTVQAIHAGYGCAGLNKILACFFQRCRFIYSRLYLISPPLKIIL